MARPTQMPPMFPAAPLPANSRAVPAETPLARLGPWRLAGVDGVPLVERQAGGRADKLRRGFLDCFLPNAGVYLPLSVYARQAGARWGNRLPSDFPAAFRNSMLAGSAAGGGLAELAAAMTVLMRVGLIVVDGIERDAVTRSSQRASWRVKEFLRREEGVAPRLYWPGNDASGVTVGPGYDMGSRSARQVVDDLTAIGVSDQAAEQASDGAAKKGHNAGDFARLNRNTLNLSSAQQQLLFDKVVPTYERLVCTTTPASLLPRLFQHEFDALLSLAWNTSHYGQYAFNHDVSRLDLKRAAPDLMTLTGGGPGLVGRRGREVAMLRDAEYQFQAIGKPPASDYQDPPRAGTAHG